RGTLAGGVAHPCGATRVGRHCHSARRSTHRGPAGFSPPGPATRRAFAGAPK
ncbi:unnamed protein product, partial [Amoebophrya sp. A120]